MPKIHKETIKDQKTIFLKALAKSLGILTPALSDCHLAYATYKKWFTTDKKFRDECLVIDGMSCDYVESQLYKLISEGNVTAVIFFLKCRRHQKWNDRNVIDINVTNTSFQIGGTIESEDVKFIDVSEDQKLIDNE